MNNGNSPYPGGFGPTPPHLNPSPTHTSPQSAPVGNAFGTTGNMASGPAFPAQPIAGAPFSNQPTPTISTVQPVPGAPSPVNSAGSNSANATTESAKNTKAPIIKTILLIVTSMLACLFIGLFIWMWINWQEVQTNVDGRIELKVAEAENALQTKLETDFAAKEKYPNRTFTGPSDYGALSFEYPKTWSVYVPSDGTKGGDFHAYFNPGQVGKIDDENPLALRVSIVNEMTEDILDDYNDDVEDGDMTMETTVVNGNNVNVYTGKLDGGLQGYACIFKIRDKTAIIQSDALLYRDDFYAILNSIRFNS